MTRKRECFKMTFLLNYAQVILIVLTMSKNTTVFHFTLWVKHYCEAEMVPDLELVLKGISRTWDWTQTFRVFEKQTLEKFRLEESDFTDLAL